MMKFIFFTALLTEFIYVANAQKSVNYSSVLDSSQHARNNKNSFKIFIKSLAKAQLIDIPYGTKNLLKKFLPEWKLPDYKNTPQNKTTQNLNNDYNSLDSFFYADLQNENRLVVEADLPTARKLISTDFINLDDSLKLNKKILVSVVQLQLSNRFKTYSLIVSGNRVCTICEFVTHQTENILINIDKQNNLIDKLIISSLIGNDLGSYNKFFFIDKNKMIHLKEFSNDELTAGFTKYKRYKIMADGHFAQSHNK